MIDYSACGLPRTSVDLLARQFPIVIEVGDDRFHERLGKVYRALLVAQTIEQNGQRKLLRAVALVGPLEAESGEALDLVVLVQLLAVDRDDKTVDRAPALVYGHGSHGYGCAGKAFHIIQQLVARTGRRIGVSLRDGGRLIGGQPRTKRQVARLAVAHIPTPPR